MAAALPTFRESTVGGMGMATASSHAARTDEEMPWPSLPKTIQQSLVKSVCERVLPARCGWAAIQRMRWERRSLRVWTRLLDSKTGKWKIAPIELRTARRRYGLLEVSPTIKAWTPRAVPLRTSAPRFVAFERASVAASRRGLGLRLRISSNDNCGGTFPIARSPWYMENPVRVSSNGFSATKTWI